MTDYTCTSCNLNFSLSLSADDLHCPKCGSGGVAERLPETLEEVDAPASELETEAPRAKPAVPSAIRRTGNRGAKDGAKPVTKEGTKGSGRRPTASEAAPEGSNHHLPKILVVALLAGVAVWYFAYRDPSKPSDPKPNTPHETNLVSAPPTEVAPLPSTGDPLADFKARYAQLAPGDIAGRKALVEFCREHDLNDQRSLVLREILLLDSEDETARRSFGFTRHDVESSPLKGRWLSKADAELAAAFDSLIAN